MAQIPKKIADLIRADAPASAARAALGLGSAATADASGFEAAGAAAAVSTAAAAALALKAPLASPAFTGTPTGDGSGLTKLQAGQVGHLKPSPFSWFTRRIAPSPTTGLPTVYNADGSAFDVASLAPPAGVTYYLGFPGFSDGNDGLSTAASFSTITKALSMADVGTIVVPAGKLFDRSHSTFTSTGGKSVTIRTDGATTARAIFSAAEVSTLLTWTLVSGATATYQCTRSLAVGVWDALNLDANGDYTRLALASSFAGTGDLAAGEYFVSGSTVYVRTIGSRNLTVAGNNATLRVFMGVTNALVTGPVTCYFQDISFEGGVDTFRATQASGRPTIYARNCAFKYNSNSNGATFQGAVSILQDCVAAQNFNDGFNYHLNGSAACESVELNCEGRDNGFAGTDINNGTTTHDGCSAVRVGGRYYRNRGPNVADVNDGTTSWNVGCGAWGSTATFATGVQNGNYQSQCSASGGMWLDACWGYADPAAATRYQFVAGAAANLYFRSFSGAMPFYRDTAANLRPY